MSNAKFLFIIYLINGMEWASLNLDRNVFSFILNKIPLKHRWLCQSCEYEENPAIMKLNM